MRVTSIDPRPIHEITYLNVSRESVAETVSIPVILAKVDGLPGPLGALLATADLQGYEQDREDGAPARLLGCLVAEEIAALGDLGTLPMAGTIGILLAGDLYSVPTLDRRGGLGDVRSVWEAFAERFRWVTGVAGNHDGFGESQRDLDLFRRGPGISLLDGDLVTLDTLRVGGIGGIVGNSRKHLRKSEDDFAGMVTRVIAGAPDVVVMHDGPDIPDRDFAGTPAIREALEAERPTLAVRGHRHWDEPLATLANGTQVLNVHERVVLLVRS